MNDNAPHRLPFVLPLRAEPNRPWYDATGRLISGPEYADVFARIANERASMLLLMERLTEALARATGPNATPDDTASLKVFGEIARNLVRAAKQDEDIKVPFLSELLPAFSGMKDALALALPELEQEAEQRETSGNDEYSAGIRTIAETVAKAIDKAAKAAAAAGVTL